MFAGVDLLFTNRVREMKRRKKSLNKKKKLFVLSLNWRVQQKNQAARGRERDEVVCDLGLLFVC